MKHVFKAAACIAGATTSALSAIFLHSALPGNCGGSWINLCPRISDMSFTVPTVTVFFVGAALFAIGYRNPKEGEKTVREKLADYLDPQNPPPQP
ncbi:MAG: hypothetical protein MRY79_06490 [Alphaproteobacteria bacterium]|nr:hypothetical protein [Alphaproteobacteria bacterium]